MAKADFSQCHNSADLLTYLLTQSPTCSLIIALDQCHDTMAATSPAGCLLLHHNAAHLA